MVSRCMLGLVMETDCMLGLLVTELECTGVMKWMSVRLGVDKLWVVYTVAGVGSTLTNSVWKIVLIMVAYCRLDRVIVTYSTLVYIMESDTMLGYTSDVTLTSDMVGVQVNRWDGIRVGVDIDGTILVDWGVMVVKSVRK